VLKRGFKSQCERRALELRRVLKRKSIDPLAAADVAAHYTIEIWRPTDVNGVPPSDLQHLIGAGSDEWSGFTLRVENRHLVLLNSSQSPRRQNSVLMHELAHIILGHELVSGTLTEAGHFVPSTYNQDQEDEAAWLGGTLLLPRPALLWMRRRQLSDDEAATHFGVSLDLLRWRVRMTGIDYQLGLASRRV
jgi:Zn-dependent peptidase ImmA (M78 family)